MIQPRLERLPLRKALGKRGRDDDLARLLDGLLIPISGDAQEFLEYIKKSFPSYTRHGISHSLTIVERIGRILGDKGIANLSTVEIFALIFAALFHDSGMVDDDESSQDAVREAHHRRSSAIVQRYISERLPQLAEFGSRLARCVGFIVEAHNLSWEEMCRRTEFNGSEVIASEDLRPGVLAVLLRIGDLLDLDADRSCAFNRTLLPKTLAAGDSSVHHDRHQHVQSLSYSEKEIRVSVRPHSRTEHMLWATWLGYLVQDIEKANTHLFGAPGCKLRLPRPEIKIDPADGAKYSLLALRFEIDDKGAVWRLLSKSVYTGRLDFVRELVNNAIDAELAILWAAGGAPIAKASPRAWALGTTPPQVYICYSESRRLLQVQDAGVGMDVQALRDYLFKVAESGMRSRPMGPRSFPSIAKFGIGFISVLTRASRVVVETAMAPSPRGKETGLRVELSTNESDAYLEQVSLVARGTRVMLWLREPYSESELSAYLRSSYVYPSVSVTYVNLDALAAGIEEARRLKLDIPSEVLSAAEIRHDDVGLTISDVRRILGAGKALSQEFKVALRNRNVAPLLRSAKVPHFGFEVERRSVRPSVPATSTVLRLGGSFEPIGALRRGREQDLTLGTWVLWVPVTFDDLERGIEWRSLHGFVVRKREIVQSVVAVGSGQSKGQFDDDEWESDYASGRDADDIPDLSDVVEDLQRLHGGGRKSYQHERDGDGFAIRATGGRVEAARYVRFAPGEMPPDSDFEDLMAWDMDPEIAAVERDQFDEIRAIHDQLKGEVFQDGIPIQVAAAELVPLGACRGVLNLTADARLDLNVTRNAIDESPEKLRAWTAGVVSSIQREVLAAINRECQRLNLSYDPRKLIALNRTRGAVAGYCLASLERVFRDA